MAEFASKGVAGSGLGLGIAGTALGLLNNGGNGGLLGGLFGGGNQNVVSALQAESSIRNLITVQKTLESIRMPIRLFIISSALKRLTSNDL